MLRVQWADEEWVLMAERAMWRPAQGAVIVADVHFGKTAAFRASGVPAPEGTTAADLRRLDRVLAQSRASHLIVLGDLLHARAGRSMEVIDTVAQWRTQHPSLHITVVRGNHDAHAGDPPSNWNMECHDEPLVEAGVALRHHPSSQYGLRAMMPELAGHVHPRVALHDVDGSTLSAPCFWQSGHEWVLPAFGSFTGTARIRPAVGDRVWVVAEGQVHAIEGVAVAARR